VIGFIPQYDKLNPLTRDELLSTDCRVLSKEQIKLNLNRKTMAKIIEFKEKSLA
jgi:hypothetical protein